MQPCLDPENSCTGSTGHPAGQVNSLVLRFSLLDFSPLIWSLLLLSVLKYSFSSAFMRAMRWVGTLFCLLILLGLLDVYVAYNWPRALWQTGSKTHWVQMTVMGWGAAGDVFTSCGFHCFMFAWRAMRQVFSALLRCSCHYWGCYDGDRSGWTLETSPRDSRRRTV